MFGGEGSFMENPTERMLRLDRERRQKPATLTTVIQELPEPKQWQDNVIEPMPSMMQYTAGQQWYVKLKDAVVLSKVHILDVTIKTVEVRYVTGYRPPLRYAKTDIEFIEQVNA